MKNRQPAMKTNDGRRRLPLFIVYCLFVFLHLSHTSVATAQSEPPLPPGAQPPTPPTGEPPLPPGLDAPVDDGPETIDDAPFEWPFTLNGFLDMRGGFRTRRDPRQRRLALGETRLQLEAQTLWERASFNLTADFLYDSLQDSHRIDLERGTGWLDLRRAVFSFTPLDVMDIAIGRQILTWGTGDLLFINDLFPKDWNSFLLGRDVEYLKAPSDAIKVSLFSSALNADIVYTPAFDADRFIDGQRMSFFNTALGRPHGRHDPFSAATRPRWFTDDEMALRLYRTFTEGALSGWEAAVYGYNGFWKSPAGFDPATGQFTFPGLSVYGASLRGAVGPGIANVEVGYYDSRHDRAGTNPLIRNSEMRYLVGYEQELAPELTGGLQYYAEQMMDYGSHTRALPPGAPQANRVRHLLTGRLTQQLMSQNLTLSLFAFYSPSDRDAYLRPSIAYKFSDHWTGEVGGNVFFGKDPHTFFGQFQDASNIYLALRYSF